MAHPNANEDVARAIYDKLAALNFILAHGEQAQLAREFNVPSTTVSMIKQGRIWKKFSRVKGDFDREALIVGKNFGAGLKNIRLRLGWTIDATAKKLEIDRAKLWKLENKKIRVSLNLAIVISRVYEISLEAISKSVFE